MIPAFASTSVLDDLRAYWRDPGLQRRAGALGLAVVMHAVALWALIALPPAMMPQVERAASAISVRLYTVAGGADADTDAPLFEPPLAGGHSGADIGQGPGAEGGAQDGSPDGAGSATRDARIPEPAAVEPVPDVEPAPEPEPVEDTPPQPRPDPETAPGRADAVPDPVAAADAQSPAAETTGVRTGPNRTSAPAPPAEPAAPGQPVATTQPPAEPAPTRADGSGPPSFADILARAQTRLDPADFQILVNFGNGVRETVRENFCLSSVDANREAFDCPEGVNPDAARLAQYGLQGLGEEPPEFLEDMDRLAFQLANMGADDSAIQRILMSLRDSRREAIEGGPLRRQMGRDAEPDNTNDVPGAP